MYLDSEHFITRAEAINALMARWTPDIATEILPLEQSKAESARGMFFFAEYAARMPQFAGGWHRCTLCRFYQWYSGHFCMEKGSGLCNGRYW